MCKPTDLITKKTYNKAKNRPFRAKSVDYGTCLEIEKLRIGQLRYIYCTRYLVLVGKKTLILPVKYIDGNDYYNSSTSAGYYEDKR